MQMYRTTERVTVTNANGTADLTCSTCGTWLKHWSKYSTYPATQCSIENCPNEATKGGHVLRPYAQDETLKRSPYIIPLCSYHNGQDSSYKMPVGPNIEFVWANVQKTCGAP